jgi:hypothetical protein
MLYRIKPSLWTPAAWLPLYVGDTAVLNFTSNFCICKAASLVACTLSLEIRIRSRGVTGSFDFVAFTRLHMHDVVVVP